MEFLQEMVNEAQLNEFKLKMRAQELRDKLSHLMGEPIGPREHLGEMPPSTKSSASRAKRNGLFTVKKTFDE